MKNRIEDVDEGSNEDEIEGGGSNEEWGMRMEDELEGGGSNEEWQ